MLSYMTVPGLQEAISRFWGYTRSVRCSTKRWTPCSPAATRWSCCRPAAESRCAFRRRPSSADGPRAGRLAAHLVDEGPGGHARRQRRARGALQQLARRRREGRRSSRGLARAKLRAALCLARAAGGRGGDSVSGAAVADRRQLHRRGRSALHQPVGPRLPARVPAARRGCASSCPASACTPTRPPRRRACAATSRRSSACANPIEFVGSFDRPNLVYRVLPRAALKKQLARRARAASPRGRHRLLHVAARGGCAGGVADRDRACLRSPITPGCRTTSAAATRTRSSASASTSSSRPWHSAWASIARTSASSFTPARRDRSSTTSRSPAARAATGSRPSAC